MILRIRETIAHLMNLPPVFDTAVLLVDAYPIVLSGEKINKGVQRR